MRTKNLKIAEIRYFDTLNNGIVIPSQEVYTFLEKVGDKYISVFTPEVEYPIYERVPYSNVTFDGWEFGTKIMLLSGECQDGLCYVIERIPIEDVLRVDEISKEELEEVILKSNVFFVERIDIIQRKKNSFFNKQLWKDKMMMKKHQEYIDSCSKGLQYHK